VTLKGVVTRLPVRGLVVVTVPLTVAVPQSGMLLSEGEGAHENPNPPALKPTKMGIVCAASTFPAVSVA
jgi:hypothetical protein